jgi:shikimate dehydrogenase
MNKFGLIGFPLSHSFSPGFFENKFKALGLIDHEYKAYPIQHVLEVEKLISDGLKGFNVTIPYKVDIIDMLDRLDETANKIGAVNCVKNVNGELIGYNTDTYGFEHSLLSMIGPDFNGKALVFGTGGAAMAVIFVLDQLGIPYTLVSRRQGLFSYEEVTDSVIKEHSLLINTTPLGMYPKISECPKIPYDSLTSNHFLYDLVYNPRLTKFLELGKNKNATIKNGEDMLILQAEKSWEIWNENYY